MMKKSLWLIFVISIALFGEMKPLEASDQAMLVSQPAYQGMHFFVCQPSWIPSGWYMTYDGYPVMPGTGGLWYYGVMSGAMVLPSPYLVGAVVPRQIAVLSPFPQYFSGTPYWLVNPEFLAVAKWNTLVDRMGILERPRMPLAWKGDKPTCLFAWTGTKWHKMYAKKDGESTGSILKRHAQTLEHFARQNFLVWNDANTPTLANQAAVWGFLWMGRMAPLNMW